MDCKRRNNTRLCRHNIELYSFQIKPNNCRAESAGKNKPNYACYYTPFTLHVSIRQFYPKREYLTRISFASICFRLPACFLKYVTTAKTFLLQTPIYETHGSVIDNKCVSFTTQLWSLLYADVADETLSALGKELLF